jgi:uncharacterized membrane protein YccC
MRAVMVMALGLSLVAGAAWAQKAQWEQDTVAAAARKLADAVKDLRGEVRKQGNPSIASAQSRAWNQFTDDLRLIENESKELASALEAGRGHDETLPMFQRLQLLVRNAREEARSLMIVKPVQEKIEVAREALRVLEPYYDL